MKKTLSILLALTMMMSLVACGSEEAETQTPEEDTSVEQELETPELDEETALEEDAEDAQDADADMDAQEEVTPATPPEEETVTPAVPPVEETITPAVPPVEETVTPAVPPVEETTPEVETPAVDAGSVNSEKSDAFFGAVLEVVPEFPAQMKVEGEFLTMTYPELAGLSTDCAVYMPMISAVAGELAIAQTSDVEAVKALFQARIDYQIAQGGFYPATIAAWESNAKIVTAGDFVMLVVVPSEAPDMLDTIVNLFNQTFA